MVTTRIEVSACSRVLVTAALLSAIVSGAGAKPASAQCLKLGAVFGADSLQTCVVPGDMDGDGALELVSVGGYEAPAGVEVRWINSDGTIGAPLTSLVGDRCTALALADLDGDGDLDVATQAGSLRIAVLLNLGDGRLGTAQLYDAIDVNPDIFTMNTGIAAADFDSDGDMDLAVTNYPNATISVFLNDGAGGMNERRDFSAGDRPGRILADDFDDDGLNDLVLTTGLGATPEVRVLRNAGSAQFESPRSFTLLKAPRDLATGDLDGDGDPDLAVANAILLNDGDGNFDEQYSYTTSSANVVALADLDRDSDLDLLVTQKTGNPRLRVFWNDGSAQIPTVTSYLLNLVDEMSTGDMDGDGDADVILADSANISILWNDGGGRLSAGQQYPVLQTPTSFESGDLTGDGQPELVLTHVPLNEATPTFTVMPNIGDGAFGAEHLYQAAGVPQASALADIDADGDLDVAILSAIDALGQAELFWNVGGALVAGPIVNLGSTPGDMLLADLDHDGDLDIAATIYSDDVVSICRNMGGGAFAARERFPAGTTPQAVVVIDLNADGNPDVAVTNASARTVSVLLNDGSGGFEAPLAFDAGPNTIGDLDVSDLDGDGDDDLVVESRAPVLLLNDAGALSAPRLLAAAYASEGQIEIEDLDLDGLPDILILTSLFGVTSVRLYLNDESATFSNVVTFEISDVLMFLADDLDNDGNVDLALGERSNVAIIISACPCVPCSGDLDRDGVVGQQDLALVLGAYATNAGGDIDGDGDTDAQDLALLLADWGCAR